MLSLLHLAALALATFPSVSAALYPTHPVARTVYKAGRSALVTWKDDEYKPHLGDMGLVRIDLHDGDGILLATLATNVDPDSLKHTVVIPSNIPPSGSGFMICFKSEYPPLKIYTATFAITNTTVPTSDGTTLSDSLDTSAVLSTLVSTSTPTSSLQLSPDATVYAMPLRGGAGESATRGARVDLEKVKFRIVFILWPALVGTLMAL